MSQVKYVSIILIMDWVLMFPSLELNVKDGREMHETILHYVISCFVYHGFDRSDEFRRLLIEERQCEQDLSRLNMDLREAYPFCRLSGPANVLIMPAFHSASISTKMLQELGGATVIGPILVGLDRSVQIVPLSANDAQLVNMAALAAFNVGG